MSNLPPVDKTISLMENDIVTKYGEISREFSAISKEVSTMTAVNTDRLTAIVSQLKTIITKLNTLNTLIARAQATFKQKLIGLVKEINETNKNTSGTNQNLRNFISKIKSNKGFFGFGTKWNVTNDYKPPRIVDMKSILQRMTQLRNTLQSEVRANKAAANQAEANKRLAEKEQANAKAAKNKRASAVTNVGSLLQEASSKINTANRNISGGQNAAARKIQTAYRAKQNRNLNSLVSGMA